MIKILFASILLMAAHGRSPEDCAGHKLIMADQDWETEVANGVNHYKAKLNGKWIVIPDAAVLTASPRGPATIWMLWYSVDGKPDVFISCFIPGEAA